MPVVRRPVATVQEVKPVKFVSSGSKMLDLVLGQGWPAGRIINVVGDKCLSGDTVVSVQRGTRPRKMTMQTLYNRVKGEHPNRNSDTETRVVADIGGYVGTNTMLDIVMSGEKLLYEITNDRGQTIRASADHKFAAPDAPDGWACLTEGLTVGDSVNCWRGTRDVAEHTWTTRTREYTYSIPYHPFGQQNWVGGRNYKRLPTARIVLEAAINGRDVRDFVRILRQDPVTAATLHYSDPALDVHHMDGDSSNDGLENLQFVEPEDHWQVHADAMPRNTKRIDVAEIVSIVDVGIHPTFDITMEAPYHNFIANGFVVHNSTGKTLLAIEACANFARLSGIEQVRYCEAEAAFDMDYGRVLGMPEGLEPVAGIETVEAVYEDLEKFLAQVNPKYPSLYVLDSLDALSDAAEMEREIDKGSYGATKARKLSELFRRIVKRVEQANCTLFIVSQIRDKLNVTFGETKTRSGGRALDFYCSIIVWLAELDKIKRTVLGIERTTGLWVKALTKKNKCAPPFRDCELAIMFGFGTNDAMSMLAWLKKCKLDLADRDKQLHQIMRQHDRKAMLELEANLLTDVTLHWRAIEDALDPGMRKY